jgi:hypothetical protein
LEAHSDEVPICDLKLAVFTSPLESAGKSVVEVGVAIAHSSHELFDRVGAEGIRVVFPVSQRLTVGAETRRRDASFSGLSPSRLWSSLRRAGRVPVSMKNCR